MSVNINSKNYSIVMGNVSFLKLRSVVAQNCPKEVREHYLSFINDPHKIVNDKKASDEFDRKTEKLFNKYKKDYGKVLEFLYSSDEAGRINYGGAKQIYEVIRDFDDNCVYGYLGKDKTAARFKDFKRMLIDCIDSKKPIIWS